MTELRRGATVTGGALIDAHSPDTWPSPEHDPAARCLVCGDAEPLRLAQINLDARDLAPVGLRGARPVMCLRHLEAAMRLVGEPRSGIVPTCVGQHLANDESRHGVAHIWPQDSGYHASKPAIRACRRHLAEAVATLVADHAKGIAR